MANETFKTASPLSDREAVIQTHITLVHAVHRASSAGKCRTIVDVAADDNGDDEDEDEEEEDFISAILDSTGGKMSP